MLLNATTAVSTPAILLVPYGEQHVLTYHEWMKSAELQEQTASEPLTLEQEYEMQLTWRKDDDKLTFIACHPLPDDSLPKGVQVDTADGFTVSKEYGSPERMIGDVNLFLRVAYELDEEENEILHRPYVRGEIELMIASTKDQGRGFGRATLLAFMQYIRNHTTEILNQYKSHSPDGVGSETEQAISETATGGLVLVSKINEDNVKSRKLFESVGFEQVGKADYFGEVELRLGESVDSVRSVDGWLEIGY